MIDTSSQRICALAIDVGSSSVRVAAYTIDGEAVPGFGDSQHYQPTQTHDGGAELTATVLLETVLACLDKSLRNLPSDLRVVAVGMDTFVTNLIGFDADGQPITPIYMWNDTRSRAYVARLDLNPMTTWDRTGAPLHVSYWPARLAWLADTQPDIFARAAHWWSFGEWLTWTLFGTARASSSMAAWTGMLDRSQLIWDADSLRAANLRPDQLSAIDDEPFGKLPDRAAARWPSLREAIWFPALGDGYTANVGCGAVTAGRAALTMGTSGALRLLLPEVPDQIPAGLFGYRCSTAETLVGGAVSNAGNVHAWLETTFGAGAGMFDADAPPDMHGLTVLPFWAGERSPGWHDDARAAILGMTLSTTSADIARASLEAVIYQLAAIDDRLSALTPTRPAIYGAGGVLAASPGLAQLTADVLERPITLCADAQASMRGTALLALGVAVEPRIAAVYQPRSAFSERYRAARERQARAYNQIVGRGL